ncbi:MAG TPA: hypothetical protein VG498_07400 [Terriglobales bacterium]|nr:hypothetical protein [Terriglobales bacterium]
MTLTAIALFLLLVGGLFLVKLLRGSVEHPKNLIELLHSLEPVNAASFRHLACDVDDTYLKANLSGREYRKLRRMRLSTIRAYYWSAFHNSSLLLSYGELMIDNEHLAFAEFGEQIRSAAIQLRLALIRGIAGVYLCQFIPLEVPHWRNITEYYNQVGSHLARFCESNFPDLEPAIAEHFWV